MRKMKLADNQWKECDGCGKPISIIYYFVDKDPIKAFSKNINGTEDNFVICTACYKEPMIIKNLQDTWKTVK